MTLFQVISVVVVGGLFLFSVVAALRGWTGRKEGIGWALLWLLAGVALLRPGMTVWLAQRLGIGRGADLVLYCAVITTMLGFFMVYARLRRLRRDLTLLTRRIAIDDAMGHRAPGQDVRSEPR